MSKKLFLWALLLVLISSGCVNTTQESDNKSSSSSENSSVEVIARNLESPWAIVKHKDIFFITERNGTITKIENEVQQRESVELHENVLHHGEGGLLGMVLHPDFENNKLAFLYHTYGSEDAIKNRLVVIKYEEDKWVEQSVLLENIEGSTFHNGGRIKIGPDSMLYVTIGDVQNPESAQNPDSLQGSILRMELDGSIPSDNPYHDSYVYSYGHRNSQGMAWDLESETMYASEHGPSARDEINIIEPGQNYGWPVITGSEQEEKMVPPLFHSGSKTWAPSGIAFHNNILYVAALRGEAIRSFNLETQEEYPLVREYGRIRDIVIEEEYLYAITNNTDGRGNPDTNDDILLIISLNEN
ncbi:PQQ-dependent sugar dehydrogenase [Sutcliffiella deserti]|uniref:PQQ-dependent sugar dehydrogenase n=1 Tax=Sutcliffiella deserti TaxID=2875501 RepID=UPI001CBF69F8|nr:PQQ-dependent sugar dehydrogenase [Sutcliffiella deserti]